MSEAPTTTKPIRRKTRWVDGGDPLAEYVGILKNMIPHEVEKIEAWEKDFRHAVAGEQIYIKKKNIQGARIAELYLNNKPLQDIQDSLGICKKTIYNHLRRI